MKVLKKLHKKFKKWNTECTRLAFVSYREEYRAAVKEAKNEYYKKQAKDLNTAKDSKAFWKGIKIINGTSNARPISLSATQLGNNFKQALNTNGRNYSAYKTAPKENKDIDREIEMKELTDAIGRLKLGKSPGKDGLTAELYKELPEEALREILGILNRIWAIEDIPNAFREAIIIPIHKKGSKKDPNNYRGISLLNSLGKIFTGIILNRLEIFAEEHKIINDFQAGYRKGYSTIDHIYTLDGLVQLSKRRGKKLYVCFLDMSAAFDTVNRSLLTEKVHNTFGSTKLTKVIERIYSNTTSTVWDGIVLWKI